MLKNIICIIKEVDSHKIMYLCLYCLKACVAQDTNLSTYLFEIFKIWSLNININNKCIVKEKIGLNPMLSK